MREGWLSTSGEHVLISSELPWVDDLIAEAAGGELHRLDSGSPSLEVRVESGDRPFNAPGWEPLTRGAWRQGDETVIEDVCSSGFDLLARGRHERMEFILRWRPRLVGRAAATLLRSRFILLTRAVLLQYPALWAASLRGRAPLHALVCTAGDLQPMLAGPGGVGKSTLLTQELEAGGSAISDNLCVSDGTTAWGVVEPLRVEGGSGRAMTYGRRESALAGRVAALNPDIIVVVRRGGDELAVVRPCDGATAAKSLVIGTYMAGELRRFWAFAATLTLGTGLGPAHAPVEEIAALLASRLPAIEIVLPRRPGVALGELLTRAEAIA